MARARDHSLATAKAAGSKKSKCGGCECAGEYSDRWIFTTRVNARFDAYRPPRLRVRVKSYGKYRVSIAVSNAGQSAQRKLVQVNTASMSADELRGSLMARIGEMIEAIYSADVARWFAKAHGDALLARGAFEVLEGFNVLVWIPNRMT
jgi:hypothetical protein